MALSLPTDTAHLNYQSRQYELFDRPIVKGIDRRKMFITIIVALAWFIPLALLGVSPLWRFGPTLYLAPVAAVVILGTRVDDSGRMAMIGWYDRILCRLPSRRSVIDNPVLDYSQHVPHRLSLNVVVRLSHREGPSAAQSRGSS
ncbi:MULTISPECIES: hypothetical protein [unclassified Crossiella]|uniref:hypothetical protein n=1 Tax=unclassified Crossiella TaxID=2620835 RepID=UPI001FFF79AD|nr:MULTISPECIES: hypothetical protein [unclassified Crossiella]MCK2239983.1 hypothetical protein [Crossiella sp. S99.2]MCK2252691.1 hypothetical protein [Crossiella sp. S99.1]